MIDTVHLNDRHGVIINAEDEVRIASERNHPESMANPVGNYNMEEC